MDKNYVLVYTDAYEVCNEFVYIWRFKPSFARVLLQIKKHTPNFKMKDEYIESFEKKNRITIDNGPFRYEGYDLIEVDNDNYE